MGKELYGICAKVAGDRFISDGQRVWFVFGDKSKDSCNFVYMDRYNMRIARYVRLEKLSDVEVRRVTDDMGKYMWAGGIREADMEADSLATAIDIMVAK